MRHHFLFLICSTIGFVGFSLTSSCADDATLEDRQNKIISYNEAETCFILFNDSSSSGINEPTISVEIIDPGENANTLELERFYSCNAHYLFTLLTPEEINEHKWIQITKANNNKIPLPDMRNNSTRVYSMSQMLLVDSILKRFDTLVDATSLLEHKAAFDITVFAEPQIALMDSGLRSVHMDHIIATNNILSGFLYSLHPSGREILELLVTEEYENYYVDHNVVFFTDSGKIAGWHYQLHYKTTQ